MASNIHRVSFTSSFFDSVVILPDTFLQVTGSNLLHIKRLPFSDLSAHRVPSFRYTGFPVKYAFFSELQLGVLGTLGGVESKPATSSLYRTILLAQPVTVNTAKNTVKILVYFTKSMFMNALIIAGDFYTY